MKPHAYKVLITTSGIGQKLGDLTKFTNKALIRIGKKSALSYIIESYSKDTPLVITLGYFGDLIRQFVSLAYPDRKNIEFVEIDKYSGEESSLGYTMLQTKDKLQCPFIYHACDTLVTDPVPAPAENWVGVHRQGDPSLYATWQVASDDTLIYCDRGAIDFDFIHIGLVGIKDFEAYWKILEKLYSKNPKNQGLNDGEVIREMVKQNLKFQVVEFPTWYDTGNVVGLNQARRETLDRFDNLDKAEESIFIFDNFVIKFFKDTQYIKDRVARAEVLKGLTPKIEHHTQNFYRYEFVKGDLYSRTVTPEDFKKFLTWAKRELWHPSEEVSREEFKKKCLDFYQGKTKTRALSLLQDNSLEDEEQLINGELVPKFSEIFDQVNFKKLSEGEPRRIHGDLVLDNIIHTPDSYCLLDWRQNFGGLIKSGDIYYDLAKLYHNLVVSHDAVFNNLFSVKISGNHVSCDILRKHNLVDCENVLFNFIKDEGYDLDKVKLITSLVWLSSSPLHHHPYNLFLYHLGKLNLWRSVKNQK